MFPGPQDITDSEIALLVRKYRDPDRSGMINYINLHHDLLTAAEIERKKTADFEAISQQKDSIQHVPGASPSVQMILDRIRMAVHKRGIRVIEFFRDYDKLRHDRITEHQFVCALSLALGKEAQLSRDEIQKLANFYRADANFIHYRDFCLAMDSRKCFSFLKIFFEKIILVIFFSLQRALLRQETSDRSQTADAWKFVKSKLRYKSLM